MQNGNDLPVMAGASLKMRGLTKHWFCDALYSRSQK